MHMNHRTLRAASFAAALVLFSGCSEADQEDSHPTDTETTDTEIIESTYQGLQVKLFDGQGAADAGFLDEVTEADQVVGRAIEVAQGFAAQLDARAYASTVRALRGDVLSQMDAAVASERAAVGL